MTRTPTFSTIAGVPRTRSGGLLLALYGADTAANRSASDAICTGLQLTNFWQDIAIDWQKDRVYLPREDLDRFGVTTAQIQERRIDDRWRALMAFEITRTRRCCNPGARWCARCHGGSARAVRRDRRRHAHSRSHRCRGRRRVRAPPRAAHWDWCAVAYHALRPSRAAAGT
jgi:hypothetical protein